MPTEQWKLDNIDSMRKYRRDHYHNNKEYYIQKTKDRRNDIKDWLNEYKSNLKCERCDEDFIYCLEFHHVNDDKDITLSKVSTQGWSIKRILKEIDKCIVLCSNCHRKEHYGSLAQ